MIQPKKTIRFPIMATIAGGAERVEYTERFAWVHMLNNPCIKGIRISRKALPPLDRWSAFNLADIVHSLNS